jgi:hypothetical protein
MYIKDKMHLYYDNGQYHAQIEQHLNFYTLDKTWNPLPADNFAEDETLRTLTYSKLKIPAM